MKKVLLILALLLMLLITPAMASPTNQWYSKDGLKEGLNFVLNIDNFTYPQSKEEVFNDYLNENLTVSNTSSYLHYAAGSFVTVPFYEENYARLLAVYQASKAPDRLAAESLGWSTYYNYFAERVNIVTDRYNESAELMLDILNHYMGNATSVTIEFRAGSNIIASAQIDANGNITWNNYRTDLGNITGLTLVNGGFCYYYNNQSSCLTIKRLAVRYDNATGGGVAVDEITIDGTYYVYPYYSGWLNQYYDIVIEKKNEQEIKNYISSIYDTIKNADIPNPGVFASELLGSIESNGYYMHGGIAAALTGVDILAVNNSEKLAIIHNETLGDYVAFGVTTQQCDEYGCYGVYAPPGSIISTGDVLFDFTAVNTDCELALHFGYRDGTFTIDSIRDSEENNHSSAIVTKFVDFTNSNLITSDLEKYNKLYHMYFNETPTAVGGDVGDENTNTGSTNNLTYIGFGAAVLAVFYILSKRK